MTEFDAEKALREEIAGMLDIVRTIKRAEDAAEAVVGKAELELNAFKKISAVAKAELDRKRAVLAETVHRREQKEKQT